MEENYSIYAGLYFQFFRQKFAELYKSIWIWLKFSTNAYIFFYKNQFLKYFIFHLSKFKFTKICCQYTHTPQTTFMQGADTQTRQTPPPEFNSILRCKMKWTSKAITRLPMYFCSPPKLGKRHEMCSLVDWQLCCQNDTCFCNLSLTSNCGDWLIVQFFSFCSSKIEREH